MCAHTHTHTLTERERERERERESIICCCNFDISKGKPQSVSLVWYYLLLWLWPCLGQISVSFPEKNQLEQVQHTLWGGLKQRLQLAWKGRKCANISIGRHRMVFMSICMQLKIFFFSRSEFEFPRAQPCWCAHCQWRAERGWCVM